MRYAGAHDDELAQQVRASITDVFPKVYRCSPPYCSKHLRSDDDWLSERQEQYKSSISKDCYAECSKDCKRSFGKPLRPAHKAVAHILAAVGPHLDAMQARTATPPPPPHSEPEYSDSDMDWDALDKTPSGRQTKARYEQEDYRRKSKDRYTPWDSTRHEMRFERRRKRVFSHMWKPYAYP